MQDISGNEKARGTQLTEENLLSVLVALHRN